jgi:hypothetical protein
MFTRRILIAAASLLSALAIAGTATSGVALASPQVHSLNVRAAHASYSSTVKPNRWIGCYPITPVCR